MNHSTGLPAAPSAGALYLRLSRDDERETESLSISNQRKLLLSYAREHHFPVIGEYADDGYSGTTFDRPAFRRMIRDVEQGKIDLILTKDLSRLGRDYIRTGEYTESFFPSRGVRFIAVGDGYDSALSSPDLVPFRNVINEMYARDISRKIRAALRVRMEEGSYIGNFAPYGYVPCAGPRRTLIPDPQAAPVVAFLFREAAAGARPSQLAALLNEHRIPCPSERRLELFHTTGQNPRCARRWSANTIIKLLHNPVYTGTLVQGKTRKLSFKSRVTLAVPPEQRIAVPDTHPAIVSEKLFSLCQKQLASRRCQKRQTPSEALTPPEAPKC